MYLLARLQRQCRKIDVSIWGANHCFRIFIQHHYSSNYFVGRTYASSISFIFPLCIKLNVYGIECLGKIFELQGFCPYSFIDLMDCQNLSGGAISSKAVLIFSENFLDFESSMIEKQGMKNLSCHGRKSCDSVVLCNSEVIFMVEGKDETFCPFLYCVLSIDCVAISEKCVVEANSFSVFNFFNTP